MKIVSRFLVWKYWHLFFFFFLTLTYSRLCIWYKTVCLKFLLSCYFFFTLKFQQNIQQLILYQRQIPFFPLETQEANESFGFIVPPCLTPPNPINLYFTLHTIFTTMTTISVDLLQPCHTHKTEKPVVDK